MTLRNNCRSGWNAATCLLVLVVCYGIARADDPNVPLPEITQQPESQAICDENSVVFSVVATGDDLSYQWRHAAIDIDGAENNTLVLTTVTVGDAGNYDVVVTNPGGSITSDAATLTVDSGPQITQQPEQQTVCQGRDVTLTVVATTQVGELDYEWLKDDEPVPGGSASSLLLEGVSTLESGEYACIVSSPCGSVTSDAVILAVDVGPQIVSEPEGADVCEGDEVTLSVTVADQGAVHEDTLGSTGSSGSGARLRGNYYRVNTAITLTRIEHYLNISTSCELHFFVYQADEYSGPYQLILEDPVTNSGTGQKYYSSNPLSLLLEPSKYYLIGAGWPTSCTYYWNYTHGAKSFGLSMGGFAWNWVSPLPDPPPSSFNDSAYMQRLTTSELSMTYQWRKDDDPIQGAHGSEYAIAEMSADDVGEYDVVINNECGNTTSVLATLTMHTGVTITQQPVNMVGCQGEQVVLSVVAEGGTLTYQWRKDGEEIEGANAADYVIEEVDPNDAGVYDVIISNGCPETSTAATLSVTESGPSINTQPANIDGCVGQPVTLTVSASGAGIEYQWYKDDVPIADATAAAYTIEAVDPNDFGDYTVTVINPCGSVTSEVATLSADQPMEITMQPEDGEVCMGSGHELVIVATGTNVSYQWRKDGVDILGETGDTYSILESDPNDTGSYDVVMTNNCGELISDAVQLDIVATPVIDEQPHDQWLQPGDPLTLAVELDLASFPQDVDTIGSPDVPYTASGKMRGNSYEVDHTTTLTLIEQYLDITSSCELVFYVYESPTGEQGPYTLIHEDTVASSGTGLKYFASNPLEVPLEAGRYYIIGAAWMSTLGYYRDEGEHPIETDFGRTVHGYGRYFDGSMPYEPTPTSSLVWNQRLTTVAADGFCQWRKDGVDLVDETSDTYCVAEVGISDAGEYEVEISNTCGMTVSRTARVTIMKTGPLPPASGPKISREAVPIP